MVGRGDSGHDIGWQRTTAWNPGAVFLRRSKPVELAGYEGMGRQRWRIDRARARVPAQTRVGNGRPSVRGCPPRQDLGNFDLGDATKKLPGRL